MKYRYDYNVKIVESDEKLFDAANEFCAQRYQECGILEKDEKFNENPDIYFVAMQNEKIVGTIGIFHKNDGALLPIEKIFSWQGDSDSIEIGRFSLYSGIQPNAAIAIVKLLFLTMTGRYRQSKRNFFIETHSRIIALFYWAIRARGIFCIVRGAPVIPCRIPAKSRKFYKEMNPRLYKINTSKLPF